MSQYVYSIAYDSLVQLCVKAEDLAEPHIKLHSPNSVCLQWSPTFVAKNLDGSCEVPPRSGRKLWHNLFDESGDVPPRSRRNLWRNLWRILFDESNEIPPRSGRRSGRNLCRKLWRHLDCASYMTHPDCSSSPLRSTLVNMTCPCDGKPLHSIVVT